MVKPVVRINPANSLMAVPSSVVSALRWAVARASPGLEAVEVLCCERLVESFREEGEFEEEEEDEEEEEEVVAGADESGRGENGPPPLPC